MVGKRQRLHAFLHDVVTSGMGEEYGVETLRKVTMLNFISATCLVFIIPMGIIAHLQGNQALGIADHLIAVVIAANLAWLRVSRNHVLGSLVGLSFVMGLYMFLLANGGVNNTAHLWYFTFPLAASFLAGSRLGAIASSILLVWAVGFFALDLQAPWLASYPTEFAIRFVPAYIVVFAFSYAFEASRERAAAQLTQRVEERTGELSAANAELVKEIRVRERAEEERRSLELRLARSQKMEAVGLLAGGVAHDLNNVLGAVVGYPELVLEELPEDSELAELVTTIKESGEKAAAIVQDLLTLARRDVVSRTPIALDEVVARYLESAEFRQLGKIHRDIRLETDLAEDLPRLVGSSVHLAKALMNLVMNAAEAMPTGGTLRIRTGALDLDAPRDGYERVPEGRYAFLEVSDTGVGISQEDLARIFEPFFTRKELGRSGSGLGMAVVWGVAKDHEGFVDVQSELGRGTTVTLYLPAGHGEVEGRAPDLSPEPPMGRGEAILVVDDCESQRSLAKRMLSRLGYEVEVQPGCEEAVRFLEEHPVDLVVLDMILEPGPDGLETYQEILRLRPGQRAIILSGFSATERVEAALRAGAGAYLRKPYTLAELGTTVRDELDRP